MQFHKLVPRISKYLNPRVFSKTLTIIPNNGNKFLIQNNSKKFSQIHNQQENSLTKSEKIIIGGYGIGGVSNFIHMNYSLITDPTAFFKYQIDMLDLIIFELYSIVCSIFWILYLIMSTIIYYANKNRQEF